MRYSGLDEEGKPKQPKFAKCGKNVQGIKGMMDDVPEQEPNEPCKLHCDEKTLLSGCVELDVDEIHPDLNLRVNQEATHQWDAVKMEEDFDEPA